MIFSAASFVALNFGLFVICLRIHLSSHDIQFFMLFLTLLVSLFFFLSFYASHQHVEQ